MLCSCFRFWHPMARLLGVAVFVTAVVSFGREFRSNFVGWLSGSTAPPPTSPLLAPLSPRPATFRGRECTSIKLLVGWRGCGRRFDVGSGCARKSAASRTSHLPIASGLWIGAKFRNSFRFAWFYSLCIVSSRWAVKVPSLCAERPRSHNRARAQLQRHNQTLSTPLVAARMWRQEVREGGESLQGHASNPRGELMRAVYRHNEWTSELFPSTIVAHQTDDHRHVLCALYADSQQQAPPLTNSENAEANYAHWQDDQVGGRKKLIELT
ncbi:hypothetical protein GQ600_2703 [Phytophthora cactorum]|nr:hypothetical protein GQ600_2703 [Phytophthora cactorum]